MRIGIILGAGQDAGYHRDDLVGHLSHKLVRSIPFPHALHNLVYHGHAAAQ